MKAWATTLGAIFCAAVLCTSAALAAPLRIDAKEVAGPGVRASGIQIELDETAASGVPSLRVEVARLDVPSLGWRKVGVTLEGTLARPRARLWRLEGKLAVRGAAGNALRDASMIASFDAASETLAAELGSSGARIDVVMPTDQATHVEMRVAGLPLAWLEGALAALWPEGRLGKGRLDAVATLDVGDAGVRANGRIDVREAAFDSAQGKLAGEAIRGGGTWALRQQESASRIDLDLTLRQGAVLLGPVYASVPEGTTSLRLRADVTPQATRFTKVHFDDGVALRFDGGATLAADGTLRDIALDGVRAQLPLAYEHYARTWLKTLGYDALETRGMFTGSLSAREGVLERFTFAAEGLGVHEPLDRLGVDGLKGELAWSREGRPEPTSLEWNALTLVHLPFGAAESRWQSVDGALALESPMTVPLLGGRVLVHRFGWTPADRDKAGALDVGLAATTIDLGDLAALFGWPHFQGTLGGAIPGMSFDGERVDFDGGLAVNVFDGFVDMTGVSLARPFAATPDLRANIALRRIDLEALTQVFDFGHISGRLDGDINGLRMLAWRPVAFEASLAAPEGGRISQRAIDSLSSLSGGISAGLQSTVLKVFKSFAYSKLGLACTLRDDVCHMRGIDESQGGGYVIVAGRGLPHIEVIGHQREVDWPTLVSRLAAVSAASAEDVRVE